MRQKHGQNFLIDLNVANNIVKAADLNKEDEVLEIGSGKGVLTKLIYPAVKRLTAVEIDASLYETLRKKLSACGVDNVILVKQDFMKMQTPQRAQEIWDAQKVQEPLDVFPFSDLGTAASFKIVSNLPYNVGTAIVQKILPLPNWTTAVFMLQKEVAQRLCAKTGGKDYGYISIFTQYYADCKMLFDVSKSCFNPQPKVVSSVIKLVNKNSPAPDKELFAIIKRSFSMRRKTILNSLSSFDKLEKADALNILETCKIDPLTRPEKLTLQDFKRISEQVNARKRAVNA
jgi:16S rRNA (adenine1518-N6/adenine1519-N6)-dimethyltransferase